MIDVAGSERLLQAVLESLLRSPSLMMATGKFAEHKTLTIVTILTKLTFLTILLLHVITRTDYITPTLLTILSCNYLTLQTTVYNAYTTLLFSF